MADEHIIEIRDADRLKFDARGLRQAVCLAGDWISSTGTEAMVRSDGDRHRHAMTYPEHHKLEKVSRQSQTIGEFLDRSGYRVCELICVRCGAVRAGETKDCCAVPNEHYVPLRKSIERILAEYFEIDLAKLDQEKRAMLAEIRRQNQADNGD